MKIVPKPTIAPVDAGTAFDDLREYVERRCCTNRIACGGTGLYRDLFAEVDDDGTPRLQYAYKRVRDDAIYWAADTVEDLIEWLNDTSFWPFIQIPETAEDARNLAADAAAERADDATLSNPEWRRLRRKAIDAYWTASVEHQSDGSFVVAPNTAEFPEVVVDVNGDVSMLDTKPAGPAQRV